MTWEFLASSPKLPYPLISGLWPLGGRPVMGFPWSQDPAEKLQLLQDETEGKTEVCVFFPTMICVSCSQSTVWGHDVSPKSTGQAMTLEIFPE